MIPIRSVTTTNLSEAIAAENADKTITRSVEGIAAEVRRLGVLMQEDSAGFQSKGISADYISTAEPLAKALEQSEFNWTNAHFGTGNILSQWATLKHSGIESRDDLYDHLDAAFTDEPDKLKILEAIGTSNVNEDIPIEIQSLVALGRNNLALLQSVGYSAEKLDQMETLGSQLAALHAQSRPGSDPKEERQLLHRTKNFAMEWMRIVRKFGKLVNNGNPERRKLYVDTYSKHMNMKKSIYGTKKSSSFARTLRAYIS